MTNIKTLQQEARDEWFGKAEDFTVDDLNTLITKTAKAVLEDVRDNGVVNGFQLIRDITEVSSATEAAEVGRKIGINTTRNHTLEYIEEEISKLDN